mgnify:CR=1 FL=1
MQRMQIPRQQKQQIPVQATALEVTDRFAQQTAVDEALLQEASNGYSLDEALIVVNPYGMSPLSAVAVFPQRKPAAELLL